MMSNQFSSKHMTTSRFSKRIGGTLLHTRFHFLAKLAGIVTLAAACLVLAASVCAQCDNFDNGDDDGWTCYDPISTFMGGVFGPQNICDVTNGAYRLRARPTPDLRLDRGRAAGLREDVTYTNFYMTVDVVDWDETLLQAFGIVAGVREVGLNRTDGYAFTYRVERQTVYITRFTDEIPSFPPIGGGVGSYMMMKGRTNRFVFKRVGSELRGEMYELPELTVPVLSAFASDTT
jgi:hypothetical protein